MEKNTITIKIGGALAKDEDMVSTLVEDIEEVIREYHVIVIHGGGAEVSALTRRLGMEPTFKDGLRMTTSEEMKYVDKVLSGLINKRLVRLFQSKGLNAVGLSGSDGRLFTGVSLEESKEEPTRTGRITSVNPRLLEVLLRKDFLPIISSTSMDESGEGLNINADSVAFELSAALGTAYLLFFSDIPGILKEGEVLRSLSMSGIKEEIKRGTIKGGMIPKVESSIEALKKGVLSIVIGQYTGRGSLADLLNGNRGTQIDRH